MRFMHGCYIGLVYCILCGSVSLGKKESLVSFSNKTGGTEKRDPNGGVRVIEVRQAKLGMDY